jgi:hypothetical protein
MSTDQLCGIEMQSVANSNGTIASASVSPVQVSQIEALATMLSRSFQNEPNFIYAMPDKQERGEMLRWFFRIVAIPASRLFGEIYTTKLVEGASLWIRPGSGLTFEHMFRNRMRAAVQLDDVSFRRWINLLARLEKVRLQLIAGPHWYLLALGVEPSMDRRRVSGFLTEPVMARADSDRLPCYVETFNEKDLSFYESLGFRVEGAGDIRGGPSFWAMIRGPK